MHRNFHVVRQTGPAGLLNYQICSRLTYLAITAIAFWHYLMTVNKFRFIESTTLTAYRLLIASMNKTTTRKCSLMSPLATVGMVTSLWSHNATLLSLLAPGDCSTNTCHASVIRATGPGDPVTQWPSDPAPSDTAFWLRISLANDIAR